MSPDPITPEAQAPMQPILSLPSSVPLMPIPMVIDLDILEGPSGKQVGMRVQTPLGVIVLPLEPSQAKALGEQLRNAGTRASLGLVVPSVRLP